MFLYENSPSITPIGEKLAGFYESLNLPDPLHGDSSCGGKNVERIIESMHHIENHQPLLNLNESQEIVDEIVSDCRKKCAQVLRAPFAEVIRSIIAACRKRLVSKAALDSDASYQHGQRHLNTLIELLGSWSNVVAQCLQFQFSRTLTRQVLSPLYTRIIEASAECVQTFKRDKELESWTVRLLDESVECNVGGLDGLVEQVAAMKGLLHQHYTFLYSSFHAFGDREVKPTSTTSSSAYLEPMLIVTQEELLQWRELDALYVTIEFGFIQHATQQALQELSLLEIESLVYIPQCVEDVFFVLGKVVQRALGTGSESNIFSVGNRIVELIRQIPSQEYDPHSILHRIVTTKAFYRKCVARQTASSVALQRILHGPQTRKKQSHSAVSTPTKASAPASGHVTPVRGLRGTAPLSGGCLSTSNSSSPSSTGSLATMFLSAGIAGLAGDGGSSGGTISNSSSNPSNGYVQQPSSPAVGLANALSDAAAVSLTGVNWWLSDQLSPYLATTGEPSTTHTDTAGKHKAPGGIAMQASPSEVFVSPAKPPSRAPLPPTSGDGYSTPGGKTGASTAHTSKPLSLASPPSSSTSKPLVQTSSSANLSTLTLAPSSSAHSGMSLDELLLNALVGDDSSDEEDNIFDTNSNTEAVVLATASLNYGDDRYEHSVQVEEQRSRLKLSERDWVVQINTLCTVTHSVEALRAMLTKGLGVGRVYESAAVAGRARSSPIELLLQELAGCAATYRKALDSEAHQLARWTFLAHIQYPLNTFCAMKFEITGQQMEDMGAEAVLLGMMRRCLGTTAIERYRTQREQEEHSRTAGLRGSTGPARNSSSATAFRDSGQGGTAPNSGNTASELSAEEQHEKEVALQAAREKHGAFLFGCESKLSQEAYVAFLRELSSVLAAQLLDALVFKAKFSEWGALFLYQEVIAMEAYVEELVDHLDPAHIQTVKQCFVPLNLALKILTLDAPGDIRRYALNRAVLGEEQVRRVLGRRVDFSVEAVARVKLTMVD